jgi:sugar porter (SP) family MFS transporter
MTATANNIALFNLFRFVGGLGVGLASIVSPMYIAEVAPARIRGRLVTLNQFTICIGLLVAIIVSYFLSFSESWRWMFASECLPILVFVIGLIFIPPSPRWLVKNDRQDEAFQVLCRIDGEENAKSEINAISDSIAAETGSFSELFQPGVRSALVIALSLAVFQQWTGSSSLLFYAPIIFQKAGFAKAPDAIFQSVLLASWLLLSTTIALRLVDRVGRKLLLLIGTMGMAVGMICIGVFFYLNLAGFYLLFIMFLSIGAYSFSLAPLAWLIMAEIFPTRIRARAMAVASVTLWISSYLINQFFPLLVEWSEKLLRTESAVFGLFALICIAAFVFCWRIVPETKRKTLEEISNSWLAKKTK